MNDWEQLEDWDECAVISHWKIYLSHVLLSGVIAVVQYEGVGPAHLKLRTDQSVVQ